MGKYLDRHNFMADEPMETYSVSLDPRDTQVKTTVNGQHTPVRTSELKRLFLLQRGQGCEDTGALAHGPCLTGQALRHEM